MLRAGLALGTLLTILLNPVNVLFPEFISGTKLFYSKLTFSGTNISYFLIQNIFWYKAISSLVLLLVISGIYPRITGLLHFLVSFSFFRLSIIVDGGDQLASNLSLLLIPLTLLDGNSNHWKSRTAIRSGYMQGIYLGFVFLIYVQIGVIYLQSSLAKLPVEEWHDGTALWYWTRHEIFGSSDFLKNLLSKLLSNAFIIYTLNYAVLLLELLVPLSLFVKKEGKAIRGLCILLISFHVLIIFIQGIFSFSIVMISSLIFYFNQGDYIHEMFVKLVKGNFNRVNYFRRSL